MPGGRGGERAGGDRAVGGEAHRARLGRLSCVSVSGDGGGVGRRLVVVVLRRQVLLLPILIIILQTALLARVVMMMELARAEHSVDGAPLVVALLHDGHGAYMRSLLLLLYYYTTTTTTTR